MVTFIAYPSLLLSTQMDFFPFFRPINIRPRESIFVWLFAAFDGMWDNNLSATKDHCGSRMQMACVTHMHTSCFPLLVQMCRPGITLSHETTGTSFSRNIGCIYSRQQMEIFFISRQVRKIFTGTPEVFVILHLLMLHLDVD